MIQLLSRHYCFLLARPGMILRALKANHSDRPRDVTYLHYMRKCFDALTYEFRDKTILCLVVFHDAPGGRIRMP